MQIKINGFLTYCNFSTSKLDIYQQLGEIWAKSAHPLVKCAKY